MWIGTENAIFTYNIRNKSRGRSLKTFEQPLSMEEEAGYLEIMHGEDKEAAHRAHQILIERNQIGRAHV